MCVLDKKNIYQYDGGIWTPMPYPWIYHCWCLASASITLLHTLHSNGGQLRFWLIFVNIKGKIVRLFYALDVIYLCLVVFSNLEIINQLAY